MTLLHIGLFLYALVLRWQIQKLRDRLFFVERDLHFFIKQNGTL